MPDPLLAAAREALDRSLDDLRSMINDAPDDALNWRPAGNDTNSIAVLAVHSMHSTRSWLSVALGAQLPQRDRDAEFRASAPRAAALLQTIDEFGADCRALLDSAVDVDWGAMRGTHARPNPAAATEVTAGWALIHALEHLREHTGQVMLTRQLFELRKQA